MAELDKIQVSDSYYDIKDNLARPLIYDITDGLTVNHEGITNEELANRVLQGGFVGVRSSGVIYQLKSATTYSYSGSTWYTFSFETFNSSRNIVRWATSSISTGTTFTLNGPYTYNMTLPTRYCTGTLDTSSTGTSFTIPTGYENGTLIFIGRPGNETFYVTTSVPITTLPKVIQLANQTNYVAYQITKTDNTIKCVLSNQSATSTVEAVYIRP